MSLSATASVTPAAAAFLGLAFRPLEASDEATLAPLLRRHPHSLSGYTFGPLYAWAEAFDYRWALTASGVLLVSFVPEGGATRHLLQPIGPLDAAAGEALVKQARGLPYRLRIHGADREFLAAHTPFASCFSVRVDRDCANYLYRAEDLATLAGRRYAKKRNLIAQAARLFEWTVEPVTAENLAEVLAVERETCREVSRPSESLSSDCAALVRSLEQVGRFGQEAFLVRANGEPAGLTLFEVRPPDTLEIHFERALRRWKGLHQVVNQIDAKLAVERGLAWVNREEDVGDPGLRKAKQSYFPARLAESLELTLAG